MLRLSDLLGREVIVAGHRRGRLDDLRVDGGGSHPVVLLRDHLLDA